VFPWKQYSAVSPSTVAVLDVVQNLKAISHLPSQQFSKRGKCGPACLDMLGYCRCTSPCLSYLPFPFQLKCNYVKSLRCDVLGIARHKVIHVEPDWYIPRAIDIVCANFRDAGLPNCAIVEHVRPACWISLTTSGLRDNGALVIAPKMLQSPA